MKERLGCRWEKERDREWGREKLCVYGQVIYTYIYRKLIYILDNICLVVYMLFVCFSNIFVDFCFRKYVAALRSLSELSASCLSAVLPGQPYLLHVIQIWVPYFTVFYILYQLNNNNKNNSSYSNNHNNNNDGVLIILKCRLQKLTLTLFLSWIKSGQIITNYPLSKY